MTVTHVKVCWTLYSCTWTVDEERWQWDWQMSSLPLGHPLTLQWPTLWPVKVQLLASIAASAAAGREQEGAVCRKLTYRPQMPLKSASSTVPMEIVCVWARWSATSWTTVETTVMRRTAQWSPSTLHRASSTVSAAPQRETLPFKVTQILKSHTLPTTWFLFLFYSFILSCELFLFCWPCLLGYLSKQFCGLYFLRFNFCGTRFNHISTRSLFCFVLQGIRFGPIISKWHKW